MEELAQTPYVPEFKLVCVDPGPQRPMLPQWLKTVPTMLVANKSSPLVGPGPVNNWLFERKVIGDGSITEKSAQERMSERNAPIAAPTYQPEVAIRGVGGGGGRLPPQVSSSQKADPSMSPPSMAGDGGGPLAYHGTEMGADKWSDDYSFLDSDPKTQNGFARNFESLLSGGGLGGGGGGGGGASAPKMSAKAEALQREFESFQASRDKDIPGPHMRR